MIELLFVCAICRCEVRDFRGFRNGRDRQLEPICKGCEHYHSERKPIAGAFMDRRLAIQLSALANALSGEAHCKQWTERYGRA